MRRCHRFVIALIGTSLAVVGSALPADAGSIGLVPDGGCLSYNSSEGTVYFCDSDIRPTGTGVFDPFLRVQRDGSQHDGTPSTYSSAWNTDAHQGVPATNDFDHSKSEALLASEIGYSVPPPLQPNGPQYAVFTVDVNQQGNQNALGDILSLNQFELFNCATNDYTTLASCTSFFDLFANGDWVNFDYRNHTGSGSGDIDVYIPTTVGFGTQYIALLDGWGCGIAGLTCDTSNATTGLFPDNDGFQEWARAGGPLVTTTGNGSGTSSGVAPEPASLLLLGIGLSGAAWMARRRRTGSPS